MLSPLPLYPMKKLYYTFLFLLSFSFVHAQLIEAEFLGTLTQTQVSNRGGYPAEFGGSYYRITYLTPDAQGVLDTASGLIAIPDLIGSAPMLCYQHGTTDTKFDVPSVDGTDEAGVAIFVGQGYITCAADYLGMGQGSGFHPYVHAATEASAAIDLLRIARELVNDMEDIGWNEQLFITGYSQGGHAAMAVHQEIELNVSDEFTVTAASHMSGSYSISGAMTDFLLSETPYFFSAYIAYVALSYQTVYGNLYNNISDFFREPYASEIEDYYNNFENGPSLFGLNATLNDQLESEFGEVIPIKMVQDSIVAILQNGDPDHPVNFALRDNDTYRWAPQAPTRLFYCEGDDQVVFTNSIIARDTMIALGATDLQAINLNSDFDHGQCVTPAFGFTVLFFGGQADIVLSNEELISNQALPFSYGPNPARDYILLNWQDEQFPTGQLSILDLQGKRLESIDLSNTNPNQIYIGDLESGLYFLQYRNGAELITGKFVKQ